MDPREDWQVREHFTVDRQIHGAGIELKGEGGRLNVYHIRDGPDAHRSMH
jgi:hypothetical protein